jgi:hypothetical protein
MQVEGVGRCGQLELLEEDLGELAVVVLSRMDDDLLDPPAPQRDRQGPGLDELRPVSDHRQDLHGPNPR